MNQYEEKNAAETINGYYLPTPAEDASKCTLPAVDRARAECISKLRDQIECIEALTAQKFYALTGRKSEAVRLS